jgi:hypothetical protein
VTNQCSIPGREKRFCILYNVQTVSRFHPASFTMGTEIISLGVKRQGREADQLPPSSTEVKNSGGISLILMDLQGVMLN